MKIVIGAFYHESNTWNPYPTIASDFVSVSGAKMLERVASTEVFREAGAEVIPTVYAFGLSSGVVTQEAYRTYTELILEAVREHPDLDGIWLHLHGSMCVAGIGSGERQLLRDIRDIVGFDIPIALTLDIHANLTADLHQYANIIRSYRTVPHVDQAETERITASLLLDCIRNQTNIRPALLRLPMVIGGDSAVGASEPMQSIFLKIGQIEQTPGIATASFFVGFAWADIGNTLSSVVVVPESEAYEQTARDKAEELATYVFDRRDVFAFDAVALESEEAVETALGAGERPVFISDTGDNTTGGAPGTGTELLWSIINVLERSSALANGKKICIASILDPHAYEHCQSLHEGDPVQVSIGIGDGAYSKPVPVNGVLKAKGQLLGYLGSAGDVIGQTCTIAMNGLDIVIADKASSFVSARHFTVAGLDMSDYDVIVVKQGYLFDELDKLAAKAIFALSPGATEQRLERIPYRHLPRPVFPFDEISITDAMKFAGG